MNARSTLALLAGVLVLGGVAWFQARREERAEAALEVPLFSGVAKDRVVAVRLENARLDDHMRIERGEDGAWTITDPEHLPAEAAYIEQLLQSVLGRMATVVPDSEADPAKLGLAPPALVLEVEEQVDGAPRRTRLEVGGVDPDQRRVNVRIDGRILRTWRDVETALARPREEYRSLRILSIDARSIVEVHREGVFLGFDGRERDARLDALSEDGVWRQTAPLDGVLDPLGMSLWATGFARLSGLTIVDLGALPLAEHGLDPAEAVVRVVTIQGTEHVLRMGRRGHRAGETWNCKLEGRPHVFALEMPDVEILLAPSLDLLDHKLWRVTRDTVETVELGSRSRTLEIVRERKRWAVRQKLAGEGEFGPLLTADRARVEDLLSALEQLELRGFEPGLELPESDVACSLRVTAQGFVQGGVLSAPETTADGVRGVRFRRDGETAVARGEVLLHSTAERPIEELLSLMVQELVEVEQRGLALSDGNRTMRFTRGSRGQWTREGESAEAKELLPLLDPLLFLRAERHLASSERVELVQSLAVTFLDTNDFARAAVVAKGLGGDLEGKTILQVEGRLSLAREQDLHGRIAKLLEH